MLDPDVVASLLAQAQGAAEHAYAPYSGLRFGAALLSTGGVVYVGCNVENASYGLTCCAERTAVVSAVAAEGGRLRVKALAIWTADLPAGPPCGACRQVIAEFGRDAIIIFANRSAVEQRTLDELLPDGFDLSAGPAPHE